MLTAYVQTPSLGPAVPKKRFALLETLGNLQLLFITHLQKHIIFSSERCPLEEC